MVSTFASLAYRPCPGQGAHRIVHGTVHGGGRSAAWALKSRRSLEISEIEGVTAPSLSPQLGLVAVQWGEAGVDRGVQIDTGARGVAAVACPRAPRISLRGEPGVPARAWYSALFVAAVPARQWAGFTHAGLSQSWERRRGTGWPRQVAAQASRWAWADILAFTRFPVEVWQQIWSNNPTTLRPASPNHAE